MADVLNYLAARGHHGFQTCTEVTPYCPVSASIYGYAPSIGATVIFLAYFAVLAIAHLIVGWRYRTWTFVIAMGTGCALEAVGYGGRYMMHVNPWSDPGFKLQIVLLTFSPAFLAAGIYLMLKHLVITFGESFSRIKAKWYTYIFITCDFISLLLQGAGGGLASAGKPGSALLDAGNNTMIAGLVFQVFTLAIFALLASEYFYRVWKNRNNLNPETFSLRQSKKFRGFLIALFTAWLTIFIRCVYRVIELAGGWGNSIMQEEALFIVLDSVMCSIAATAILIFHPGYCFNYRVINQGTKEKDVGGNSSDELGMQSPLSA